MFIALIVLAIVFILIAVRRVGKFRLEIWQIMLGGALAVLLTLQIKPLDALKSINLDVMLFLFCMFVIGAAMEESGYLEHLSFKLFKRAKTPDALLAVILLGMGLAAALLMNDTIAIIGTPIVLLLAKRHGLQAKSLLLALAFAITIGSVMSPIGNPQNLLIALQLQDPLGSFARLILPTLISLAAAFLLIRLYYKTPTTTLTHKDSNVKDEKLAGLCRVSLITILGLIALKILLLFSSLQGKVELTAIALVAASPILLLSDKRKLVLEQVDYKTLVFFASMFVLMQAVWLSGFFQQLMNAGHLDLANTGVILAASVVVSQFISNVPLVALFLPVLQGLGASTASLIALAAGSTIAGNLFILGAASNVIIIQNAEKRGETITFLEFARIGIPLTIINVLVYWLFL
jgi:Na+/H+ antiporter NhaD/arsenite permease-like protein